MITIRNRWALTFLGWYKPPSYCTAHWKLWALWLWKGHDHRLLYWPKQVYNGHRMW